MSLSENSDAYSKVKKVCACTTQKELTRLYSEWSNSYDEDVKSLEYIGPLVAAKQLDEKLKELNLNNDVRILDLGCGTGLVGEQLYNMGYKNIDGIDFSDELLKVAESKKVYRYLRKGKIASADCRELGVIADQYDAAICVGVFTAGHVKGEGFNDLVHVVKSGGLVCFSVNAPVLDDPQSGYTEKIDELTNANKWKLVSKYLETKYFREGKGWFFVFEIL
ncbi:methyltransferase-like protein 27 [Xenia sp. Carnegie-2017]|uniref:methyltransferase-like protein 27 n=1 Tax=Xenia sp. Carnegie-2017 TaxID=2897299 RepID=UPI001F03B5FA|nr:methyltransferase-like protein 27 [Xenia sp. Carnegie-2017]